MIKVGTVCYLIGGHSRAGQCCTVTAIVHRGLNRAGTQKVKVCTHYQISLASGEWAGLFHNSWGALHNELIPIAPPGLIDDTPADVPVKVRA